MKINKQAWHFYFASFGNDYIKAGWYETDYGRKKLDFCLYVRAILKGMLLSALIFCFVTGAAWCVVSFVLWIVVSLMHGWFVMPLPAAICAGCLLFVALGFVFYAGQRATQAVADVEPIREAYKAWKGKYCPLVTLD